jgi:hypothetical protein
MIEFIRLFAPHISSTQLERVRKARSQRDIDEIFDARNLPVYTGRIDDVAATGVAAR